MSRPVVWRYGWPSRLYPEPRAGWLWVRLGPYLVGWLPDELR